MERKKVKRDRGYVNKKRRREVCAKKKYVKLRENAGFETID